MPLIFKWEITYLAFCFYAFVCLLYIHRNLDTGISSSTADSPPDCKILRSRTMFILFITVSSGTQRIAQLRQYSINNFESKIVIEWLREIIETSSIYKGNYPSTCLPHSSIFHIQIIPVWEFDLKLLSTLQACFHFYASWIIHLSLW